MENIALCGVGILAFLICFFLAHRIHSYNTGSWRREECWLRIIQWSLYLIYFILICICYFTYISPLSVPLRTQMATVVVSLVVSCIILMILEKAFRINQSIRYVFGFFRMIRRQFTNDNPPAAEEITADKAYIEKNDVFDLMLKIFVWISCLVTILPGILYCILYFSGGLTDEIISDFAKSYNLVMVFTICSIVFCGRSLFFNIRNFGAFVIIYHQENSRAEILKSGKIKKRLNCKSNTL